MWRPRLGFCKLGRRGLISRRASVTCCEAHMPAVPRAREVPVCPRHARGDPCQMGDTPAGAIHSRVALTRHLLSASMGGPKYIHIDYNPWRRGWAAGRKNRPELTCIFSTIELSWKLYLLDTEENCVFEENFNFSLAQVGRSILQHRKRLTPQVIAYLNLNSTL